MSRVLFWDPACQAPYDTDSVRDGASGGAEGSLSRIADAIGASVVQHNRTFPSGRYLPPAALPGITHVVVNRDVHAIPGVAAAYPGARIVLWVHDRIEPGSTRGRVLARSAHLLADAGARVVCVSDWQRQGVQAVLHGAGVHTVPVDTIYNPVSDALVPDGTPVDADKLVFFSSPNKGLSYALDAFVALRRRFPSLRLVVGDPGYRRGEAPMVPGVFYAGPRPPSAMHADVRGALCTFFPNFVVPETFGLVFAESLALGTPVPFAEHGVGLAHPRCCAEVDPELPAVAHVPSLPAQRPRRGKG